MNVKEKNRKGFTMVELIIVVAIIGIISALLVPAFGTMSTKARLTTDIATVKTLKRTADSYKAEQGTFPEATNLKDLNSELKDKGYIETYAMLQTKGAEIEVSGTTIRLDVTNVEDSEAVDTALKQMDEQTVADWVKVS